MENALHNKKLRALAFIYASMQGHSAKDLIDCIIPLIKYAIAPLNGELFDSYKVSKYVKDTFPFLDLPIYMLSQLMPRLIQEGFIEQKQLGIYLIKDINRLDKQFELTLNSNDEEIEILISDLSAYAASKNFNTPSSFKNWESALLDFFNNANTSDMHSEDNGNTVFFLIASYINSQSKLRKGQIGICTKLYYAISVIDLIVDMSYAISDDSKHLDKLIVFYDTTVIMRLLGTSGKSLLEATMQMHKALLKLGCSISYFDHVSNEVDTNLDYIALSRYNKEIHLHPETREAIIKNEFRPEEAQFIRSSLEAQLNELHIYSTDINYKDFNTVDQIDETTFANILGEGALHYSVEARKKDARSLAYIVSLRAGQTSKTLSMCQYIMITHNNRFFNQAQKFCIDASIMTHYDIPPVSTLGKMTTLTWLLTTKNFPEELVTKKLLSDCYSACVPSTKWENAFWEKYEREGADPTEEMNAIKNYTARKIALEESFGDSNIIQKISMTEFLAKAHEELIQQTKESSDKGREEGKKEAYDQMQNNVQQKSQKIAHTIVVCIKAIVYSACVIFFFLPKTWLWWAINLLVFCTSLADLFGWEPATKFFLYLEQNIQKCIQNIIKIFYEKER